MASNSSQIQIKPLKTIEELKTVEELQLEVWGCSEREILPSLALIPLLDIGGVLIGAFDGRKLEADGGDPAGVYLLTRNS